MARLFSTSVFLALTLIAGYAAGAVALTRLSAADMLPAAEAGPGAAERPTDEGVFVVAIAAPPAEAQDLPAVPVEPGLLILVCDSMRSGEFVAGALRGAGYARVTVVKGAATRRSTRGGAAPSDAMGRSCARWRPFGAGA